MLATSALDVASVAGTVVAAVAAALSTYFAWRAIRATQQMTTAAAVVARGDRFHFIEGSNGNSRWQGVLVIQNIGQATALDVAATVISPTAELAIASGSSDEVDGAAVIVRLSTLAPGASISRVSRAGLIATARRVTVELTWRHPDGRPDSAAFEVEI